MSAAMDDFARLVKQMRDAQCGCFLEGYQADLAVVGQLEWAVDAEIKSLLDDDVCDHVKDG